MEDKKNIDRLFQERFKNIETPAPADAWENISSNLNKKDKPDVFPLWWKIAGIAAALVLIFSAVLWNSEEPISRESIVIETPADSENADSNVDTNSDQSNSKNIARDAIAVDETENSQSDENLQNRTGELKNKSNFSKDQKSSNEKQGGSFQNTSPEHGQNALANKANSNPKNSEKLNGGGVTESISKRKGIASQEIPDVEEKVSKDSKISLDAIASIDDERNSDANSAPTLQEIAAAEKEKLSEFKSLEQDLSLKKWSAATVVAPVYANTLGGSSVNSQVVNNANTAEVNLSYGVAIAYNLSPRWSVRSGVSQIRMNYNTEDINYGLKASTFDVNRSSAGIAFDPRAVNKIGTSSLNDSFAQELMSASTFASLSGELSQQLGYIEVPLEVKYRLMDSKFGISILGGMSALFLTDNEVSISNDGRKLELGEDANFQNFNQSANFGFGVDYRFTERLGISVEPTFKYQLNTLRNDTADFKPYTIGVYTGLMYRF
ncbi:outer membrane beta-barrel protein [Nonlabens antarcticus]|uniref:outer membrane beta-barrel protein n=1 Tax=Nonlabens antarcticus TaxID=392714 RepID=UPI00189134AF|nr:outer membrane beta-barrel protein [Nonlabens antarcticus]